MDSKLAKLKEYLQMETEIPFEEFKSYYTAVMEQLNTDFKEMSQEACLQARYICSIVQANAESRSHRDKINGKAFKKIAGKCGFWMEAIDYRLKKEGLGQGQIDTATNEINKQME